MCLQCVMFKFPYILILSSEKNLRKKNQIGSIEMPFLLSSEGFLMFQTRQSEIGFIEISKILYLRMNGWIGMDGCRQINCPSHWCIIFRWFTQYIFTLMMSP